ncbi:hypothetical protein SK128_027455 [Halocaridina rubra]|uniref:PPIase cyclophilin-type domain-containing protein n=1 Tax=Halocaridina rubra TaxID=373956 RepID=A0AAN8XC83_HALRR
MDFGRNYEKIEHIRYTPKLENTNESLQRRQNGSPEGSLTEVKKDAEYIFTQCVENISGLEEDIEKNIHCTIKMMHSVNAEKRNIENNILRIIGDILSEYHNIYDSLAVKHMCLHKSWEIVREKKTEILNRKDRIKKSDNFTDVDVLRDAEQVSANIKTLRHQVTDTLSSNSVEFQRERKILQAVKEKFVSVQEMLKTVENDEGFCAKQLTFPLQRYHDTLIDASVLMERRDLVRTIAKNNKLYALKRLSGVMRCAKISYIDDEKLCVHTLREGPPSPTAALVDYDDLLKLENPNERITFLELSTKNNKIGRIYIRLTPKTKLADQFFILCSGQIGHAFLNTNILSVRHKDSEEEYITFGDYTYNDKSGGISLFPEEVKQDVEKYDPWLEGTVDGMLDTDNSHSTIFDILMRDNPNKQLESAFGKVVKGLDILKAAIRQYPNIQDIYINDCGFTLSY